MAPQVGGGGSDGAPGGRGRLHLGVGPALDHQTAVGLEAGADQAGGVAGQPLPAQPAAAAAQDTAHQTIQTGTAGAGLTSDRGCRPAGRG